jgi:alpha-tubulin suppressor-like RCC1 family protein
MRWTQVSVGSVSGAIAEDGSLWAWGDYLRPTPFGNMRLAPGLISRYGTWLSLCCGGGVLRVLAGDGTIWHVTRRSTLARRTQPLLKTPLDFFDDPAFDDVSEAMRITQATPSAGWVRATLGEDRLAIRADGTLWARRDDEDGTLELDDVVRGWGLLRFGSDTDWVEVKSAGGATLALKADGSLWGWGTAAPGPMGTPPRLSPERIDGRSNWVQVEPGHDRCFALRADGCLFWWGHAFDWDRRREVPVRVPVS